MTSPQDEAECLETVNIPRESYSCQKFVVIVPFPSKIQAILLNMDSCESDIESFGDSELSESYFEVEVDSVVEEDSPVVETPKMSRVSLGTAGFWPGRLVNLLSRSCTLKCLVQTTLFFFGSHLARLAFTKSTHFFLRFLASWRSSPKNGIVCKQFH